MQHPAPSAANSNPRGPQQRRLHCWAGSRSPIRSANARRNDRRKRAVRLLPTGSRFAPARWRDSIRPWFWLAPALILLAVFLILPTIGTIVRSFQNQAGSEFIGLDNYTWFFGSDDALIALRNSALWVIFLTGVACFVEINFVVERDDLRAAVRLVASLLQRSEQKVVVGA